MLEVAEFHAQSRWEESVPLLARLVDQDPENPEVNRLYGIALIQTGEYGLAVWPLQKVLRSPEADTSSALLLAQAFMMSGNYEDGLSTVLTVLEKSPKNVPALSLAVQARLSLNLEAEALPDIAQLMDLEPLNPIPRSWYVTALIGLGRLEEADGALVELRKLSEGGGEADSARLCAAHAVFAWERGEFEEALELFEACLEAAPTDYNVVSKALAFFDDGQRYERATEILRTALEGAPETILYRASLAERLNALGQPSEAEEILRAGVLEYPSFETWSSLANFYIAAERFPEASESLEHAIELVQEPSPALYMMQADLWIEEGRLDAARELTEKLDSPLRDMLNGKILLAEGQPAEALKALEAGIQLWPDNALSRYLAAQAAEQLGLFDRAVSEYRDSLRTDAAYTDAGLRLSRLQRRLRNFGQALIAIRMHVEAHPLDLEGRLEMVRVTHNTGPAELMARSVAALSELPGQVGRGLAESARIIAAASGPEAALVAIEGSGLDIENPMNAEALEAWVEYAIASGRAAAVLARVDSLLLASPKDPLLHEVRAQALLAGGASTADVEAAYRRSLELGGERVASLHALGSLYAVAGDRPRALEFYDRATRADPEEFGAAWAAIELLIAEGQASALEAENRLEALLTADPPHARASLALARILLARGDDLTRAQALAKRSIRVRETPMALETLAAVYLELGEPERALRLAERGLVARPESGPLLFGLGRAMLALGRIDEARSAFESAAAAKGFEGAPLAREQLSRLVK